MRTILQIVMLTLFTAGCASTELVEVGPISYANLLSPPETIFVTRSEQFGYGLMYTDEWFDAKIVDGAASEMPTMIFSDSMGLKFYLPPGFDGRESEWRYGNCQYSTARAVFPRDDIINLIKAECEGQTTSYYQFAQNKGLLAFALGRSTNVERDDQGDLHEVYFLVGGETGFGAKQGEDDKY